MSRFFVIGLVLLLAACATASGASGPRMLPQHAVVAPIFDHGEGRAADGSALPVPAVYFPSDEAISIIIERAAKKGVRFVENYRHPIAGVTYRGQSGWMPFTPDLFDPDHGIAVHFISQSAVELVRNWNSGARRIESSAQMYDFKKAARELSARVDRDAKEGLYFGAIYDPGGNSGNPEPILKDNRGLIRDQVDDFLDWLSSKGAL